MLAGVLSVAACQLWMCEFVCVKGTSLGKKLFLTLFVGLFDVEEWACVCGEGDCWLRETTALGRNLLLIKCVCHDCSVFLSSGRKMKCMNRVGLTLDVIFM